MTINELIRELQKYDGNQEVLVYISTYVYDPDGMRIPELMYFEPDVWDDNVPEKIVLISPGRLISE